MIGNIVTYSWGNGAPNVPQGQEACYSLKNNQAVVHFEDERGVKGDLVECCESSHPHQQAVSGSINC